MLRAVVDLGNTFQDVQVTVAGNPGDIEALRDSTVDKLVEALQRRFDDKNTDVLQACHIVQLNTWPDKDDDAAAGIHVYYVL